MNAANAFRVECPRCSRQHMVTFANAQAKPCVECPCKGLLEVSRRRYGPEDGDVSDEAKIIGTWTVTHHLYGDLLRQW